MDVSEDWDYRAIFARLLVYEEMNLFSISITTELSRRRVARTTSVIHNS